MSIELRAEITNRRRVPIIGYNNDREDDGNQ